MEKNYVCGQCGIEFSKQVFPRGGVVASRKTYCSSRCKSKAYYIVYTKNKRDPIISRNCQSCGISFTPVRYRSQVSCSADCNIDIQQKRNKEINKAKRPDLSICEHHTCKKEFVPMCITQKFCSHKCYENSSRVRYASRNRDILREKQREYRKNNPGQGLKWAQQSRWGGNWYLAMQRDNFTCQKCGSKERLMVHHLDGEGQTGGKNHELSNLQVVCRPCHKKLHMVTTALRINGELFVKIGEKQYKVI